MSWVAGIVGNVGHASKRKLESLFKNKLYGFEENGLHLWAGGNKRTCFFPKDSYNKEKFIAVGIGIEELNGSLRFIDTEGWAKIDSKKKCKNLSGHFVLVRWNENLINIYTDQIGIRDIFFYKISDNAMIFSTRADWIVKLFSLEIDYRTFGAKWMLFNQLSSESIFNKIERINASGTISINRKNLTFEIAKDRWLPDLDKNMFEVIDYKNKLEQLTLLPLAEGRNVTLCLSGGFDSRFILSFLLKNSKTNWSVATLGIAEHPDSVIAKKIACEMQINHKQIDLEMPSAEDYVEELTDFSLMTTVFNSSLGYFQLRNINKLNDTNEVVIDGACGEIWRREFFSRMLLFGKNALESSNINYILPFLLTNRGNVFTEEVNEIMLEGCRQQLNKTINDLPRINVIGIKNWIDLFAIKTKMMNALGGEQSRLDNIIFSYMPFIQPYLLNNVLNFPLQEKENGKFQRSLIKNNFNDLRRFSLVKGTVVYPYRLNTMQMRSWSYLYNKLKLNKFSDDTETKLLALLKPVILDLLNSKNTIECSVYDKGKLLLLSDNYKRDALTPLDKHTLHWWIVFELFRRNFN